jgi:hypothetical protein
LINILIFILFSCQGQQNENISVITFTTGTVTVNDISVSAGKILTNNDTIKTADNSYATIQLGNKIIITIKNNTEIIIRDINFTDNKENCSIDIHYGNIFNKITKSVKQFNVRTSTLIAAVRGTSFSISCDEKTGKSMIQLLKGKLKVTPVKVNDKILSGIKEEGIILTESEKIYSKDDMSVIKSIMDTSEIEELNKFELIQPVVITKKMIITDNKDKVIEKKSTESSTISEAQKNQIMRAIPNIKPLNESNSKEQTYHEKLNEIKIQNHGQLDVLNLKDGRNIKGMLQQRGMVYRIKTPTGIKEIVADDIASQTIIK